MKSVAKLKDRARKYEQQEDWLAAIDTYKKVLVREQDEDEFETDLGLANRIGDLYLRLGQADEAVSYYVAAADKYADAGFFNNAIALCNKALRHRPALTDLYLRLSDLCAKQGFQTDARRWILEYADRQMRFGKEEPAFQALADFADMSGDPEVRETLASHLASHNHSDDALTQLRLAYEARIGRGETTAAAAVVERARAIDPTADLARARDVPVYESDAVEDDVDWEHPTLRGLETRRDHTSPAGEEVAGLEGFETTGAPFEADPGHTDLDGLEAPPSDVRAEPEEADATPTPSPAEGSTLLPQDASAGPGSADTMEPGDDVEPLPLLEERKPISEDEPLPLLDFGCGEGTEEGEDAGSLRFGVEPGRKAPADVAGGDREVARILERGRDLVDKGRTDEALRELKRLHVDRVEREVIQQAVLLTDEIIRRHRDDVPALQQRVDYALRLDDVSLQVQASKDLADALARLGAETKARDLYARILELDPEQHDVRAAFERLAGEEGALSLGEPGGAPEATPGARTRRSDADPGFAEMLTQFRSTVPDAAEPQEAGDHYDLGLAFKEMGLLDEAIAEFKKELDRVDVPKEKLRIYEELGQCHIQKGHHTVAVTVLEQALEVPEVDESDLLGIYYHLGHCYSELGQPEDARATYGKILAVDDSFADVPDRMAQL